MIRRGHDLSALPPTVLRPQPCPMGTAQKTLSNGLYLNVNLSAQSVLDHCHKILAAYREINARPPAFVQREGAF